MTSRLLPLASLALGIALGVVTALYLVFWRSGAEPDEPPATGVFTPTFSGVTWIYDGEAVGV